MEATRGAVRDLVRLEAVERMRREGVPMGEVVACRINAGCFGVEWGATRRVLVEEGVPWRVVDFEGVLARGRERGGEGKRGREEKVGGMGGDVEVGEREGDGLWVENGVEGVDALEIDALGREGPVSSSMRVATGTAMQDGVAVPARRGKRRQLG